MSKTFLLLGLAALLVSPVLAEDAPARPFGEVVQGYSLNWSDEFNGTALDTANWNYRVDGKGWSQQQEANVTVANGHLFIAGKKEPVGEFKYTGGGLISKKQFEYGYYEARFKVPSGTGWHTSFWAMIYNGKDTKHSGTQELDFCEQDSINLKGYYSGVLAWDQAHFDEKKGKDVPKSYGHKDVATPDLYADFHVWGCEFTPTTVKFFFDGKLTQETDATKFKHGPQNIWLTSIAIWLSGTKAVDETKLPSAAEFDYVRFFAPPESGKTPKP